MTTPSPSRDGADRCPGLLAPFVSADGAMVRLRLPGGLVEASTLRSISALAGRFGDPDVTLTSRGSLQLRGLPAPLPRELVDAIGALGLVPSGPHDKARNIIADPAGDLDDLVVALDEGLLADPHLAGLPGRFLMAVAGPGGPVLGEPWDIAVVAEGSTARVLVGGRSVTLAREDAADVALDAARRFLDVRPDERAWNVRDLPADARADLLPGSDAADTEEVAAAPPVPGPMGADLVALVPLGLVTPGMAAALGASPPGAGTTLRLTPWRSVVIPGGADRAADLADVGLAVTPDSAWTVLSACAGAPSCGRTTTPTRDLARAAAPFVDPAGPPVHVIGCDRSCGHPAREHVTALNPTTVTDIVAAQGDPSKKDS